MADTKITALTALTAADPANDVLPIVDVSDTTMAASGTTKKISVNNILGASGTATLASATITGDLTVDTSTLKVDSTNNRVGIQITSPTAPLEVGETSGTALRLRRLTSGNTIDLNFYNTNTTVGDVAGIRCDGDGLANTFGAISFWTTQTPNSLVERYRISSVGVHTWQNVGGVAGTAMTLNSTGLGVGVTPSAWVSTVKALDISSGGAVYAGSLNCGLAANYYLNSSGNYIYKTTAFAAGYIPNYANNGSHVWFNAPSGTAGNAITFTQAMTLDASGNLLVGTTSMPSGVVAARLVAKSTSADWSGVIWNSNATPYGVRIQHDTDSNNTGNEFLNCLGAANLRASIRSNGGIANYQANNVNLSDIRTKTDIKPLASYWNKIKSLELVTFKYKDQTHSDDNIGLIAQQVESVAPELVDVDGFGETPSDGVPIKTIYTTDLYHAAIKALQEAMARIEALEAKLA